MKQEVEDFLRNDLRFVCEDEDDPETRAYAFIMTLSAVGEPIDEILFKEILNPCCSLSSELVSLYAGTFMGMGLFKMTCNCHIISECLRMKFLTNRGFALGNKFWDDEAPEYKEARSRVENLELELEHL